MGGRFFSKTHVLIWAVPLGFLLWSHPGERVSAQQPAAYVGSRACMECHEAEYTKFTTYAKKAASYEHIKKMQRGLTAEEFQGCFECHTTGYGKPGGFKSEKQTPNLRDVGCESCHGPGSLHVKSEDAAHIKGKLTAADCEACHSKERVEAFNYKPLVYGGAH